MSATIASDQGSSPQIDTDRLRRAAPAVRIALCRSILGAGRPDDERTIRLAIAALSGASYEEMWALDRRTDPEAA